MFVRALLAPMVGLTVLLSGCAGITGLGAEELPACTAPKGLVFPADGTMALSGPSRVDLLAVFPAAKASLAITVPERWKWDYQDFTTATSNGTFVRVGVKPDFPDVVQTGGRPTGGAPRMALGGGFINWTSPEAKAGLCEGDAKGSVELQAGFSPNAGRGTGAPGKGAHVYYAGFYTNGTLFETNIKDFDAVADWPRAGFYAFREPALAVFIYDKDRAEGEDSKLWNPPPDPASGKPGWRYATTIKGFNDALKGLPSGVPKAFVIQPADAYPTSGRLKGEALVFYVVIDEVVDVPCPSTLPNRNVCRLPAANPIMAE